MSRALLQIIELSRVLNHQVLWHILRLLEMRISRLRFNHWPFAKKLLRKERQNSFCRRSVKDTEIIKSRPEIRIGNSNEKHKAGQNDST